MVNKNSLYQEVRKFLSSIDYINYGGCGFAALLMHDALRLEGKHHKIVYLYDDRTHYHFDCNNEAITTGNLTTADSCSHICLKRGKEHFDATEDNKDIYKYKASQVVSRKHLIHSLKYGTWNNMFNQDAFFNKFKKKFGICLNRYAIDFKDKNIFGEYKK